MQFLSHNKTHLLNKFHPWYVYKDSGIHHFKYFINFIIWQNKDQECLNIKCHSHIMEGF
jgi:hypothetical protein